MSESIEWLELVLGFSCNCHCVICPSTYLSDNSWMAGHELVRELEDGRAHGATGLWLGGGEPTLHPKLLSAIRKARGLGYQHVRLQTNGLRLAYPAYTEKLSAAGVSEVAVLTLGATPEVHDLVAQTPGAFESMLAGVSQCQRQGLTVEADILISTRSLDGLVDAVERLAGIGITAVTFWLVSLHGLDGRGLADWLPTLQAVTGPLCRALDTARELGMGATTLHTPPCTLPATHRAAYVHSGHRRLRVVTPGGQRFLAQSSPMEGGTFVDACDSCLSRGNCLGLRGDYLAVHGDPMVQPITHSDELPAQK